MNTKPILFSGAMVRAILDGTKTQTRRIVKADPGFLNYAKDQWVNEGFWYPTTPSGKIGLVPPVKCPYGKPGEQLWVRETFGYHNTGCYDRPEFGVYYRVDSAHLATGEASAIVKRWRPSIHMPRWASRLTLEILSIRVERLQDISGHDAMCEGVEFEIPAGADPSNQKFPDGFDTWQKHRQERWFEDTARVTYMAQCVAAKRAIAAYRVLWESINGPGSWDANPWVWVVEFKKVEAGR